jgi:hypothetical protein
MTIRKASCTCGQLNAQVSGEPARVTVCHCLECQRRTGSTFGEQARFLRKNVTVSGNSTDYTRVGDKGGRVTLHFCPVCGSVVYYEVEAETDLFAIPVGAFADPDFPAPNVSIYESRMHSWVVPPSSAEHSQ